MPRSNARNKKQKYITQPQLSPRPSPPTQLPTPLPEEDRLSSALQVELIDFDTPTPPPLQPIHVLPADDIDSLNLQDEQDDILTHTYRSPPFREAHLPDIEDQTHSPPPLPIPPRQYQQEEGYSSLTASSGGHTRCPTYSRCESLVSTIISITCDRHVCRVHLSRSHSPCPISKLLFHV